jgi:hypothetical protein
MNEKCYGPLDLSLFFSFLFLLYWYHLVCCMSFLFSWFHIFSFVCVISCNPLIHHLSPSLHIYSCKTVKRAVSCGTGHWPYLLFYVPSSSALLLFLVEIKIIHEHP